jgi:hypothetical protein
MKKISKKMVSNVLEKFSMARGIVVLDENVAAISNALRNKNLRVLNVMPGMSDDSIKQTVLSGRIFITNNTQDFIYDAKTLEYGIISTEGVRDKNPDKLAQLISDAIIKHSLWAKKHSFLVRLTDIGSTFKNLI